MKLNYDQFVKKYFPVQQITNLKESSTLIFLSKQGQIIKEQNFTENEWLLWREYFRQEIELQNILNEYEPNYFLKILDWAEEFQEQLHKVLIIYENQKDSQNLELYIKNNTISQEKLINIIIQILGIGMALQRRMIFHLNITPKNLIYVNGFIKLTDFGSSRVIHKQYYSQKYSEERKYYYHFYQSTSMLKIKMKENLEEQDLSFQEIVSNELLQNQIFQQNDEWSLSLIICQIITKQFDIKIKHYEDFFCFNSFRIKEMMKQVRNSFPQLYIFCNKLIEQRLGLKVAYNTLIEITSSSKASISKIKPLIMRLDPLNNYLEREQATKMIEVAKNYYYVSKAEIQIQEEGQIYYQLNSNNLLTTAPNNSKKSIDDEKQHKLQILHQAYNLINTFFVREPLSVNKLNNSQLKQLHLIEKKQQSPKIQHQHTIRDLQSCKEISGSEVNSMQQSFINQNIYRDSILYKKSNQLKLATIIQLFWDQDFMQNYLLKQFYIQSSIHGEYEFKFNDSQSHLFNYKSKILRIQDKKQIYQGYEKDNIPYGIGIKLIREKNWKLIFGVFENDQIFQSIMIEQNNQRSIQIYQGKLNENQMKEGQCIFDWFRLVNNNLLKYQKHIGLIKQNKIYGYGVRIYYQYFHSQINFIYKGNFENSQKQGKGQLFKEQDGNLDLIFDGEFKQDQYSGVGLAYFQKDLTIQATFLEGKINQFSELKFKENSVTIF
ncbi:unnamed protein product [Paramecium pentaurelia]|uniref:Protein kinase domain-containing protein n=1 Tax=Paramecium pentaurelia TaxID=43138 RepID=A0A8S1WA61_9CILI|nr:unnamed protein product [Paramecium pentaurelia]